ncbi:MAG: hypothetical protein ABR600_04505 [Actinomycetota bacterium]
MSVLSSVLRRVGILFAVAAIAALVPVTNSQAVSDGDYDNTTQGCTGNAFNSDQPDRTEAHCYITAVRITDGTHDYVTIGIPMTKDGEGPSSLEVCIDLGSGTRNCALLSQDGVTQEKPQKGTAPDPASGMHVYFGMNDNIDNGEHDSSEQVNNGPSDGGGAQLNVDPASVADWLASLQKGGAAFLLTHPLPAADGGVGFCADGICMSAQTQQRVIFQGGNRKKHRDVANYQGKRWDPDTCSGPSDKKKDCGGHTLKWWDKQEGTVYGEPGIQIYEDPDAQGSPIGPYPLTAFYVGTCGLVIGGGDLKAPDSPFTNKAHQLVVTTGC